MHASGLTYVLVHARWHGAWCWERVAERLRRAGATVVVPDRVGFDRLREVVEAQATPVVLVGHSSSGMTISALAECVPDRIALLAYVSAFLLPTGMIPPDISRHDDESILADHVVVDAESSTMMISDPAPVLFNDCDPADAKWAESMLVAESVTPPAVPTVTLTDQNFGRIPKVYVECLADRALGPAAQRRMYEMTPCRRVYGLMAGHSPFLSAPDALSGHLLDAGARFVKAEGR